MSVHVLLGERFHERFERLVRAVEKIADRPQYVYVPGSRQLMSPRVFIAVDKDVFELVGTTRIAMAVCTNTTIAEWIAAALTAYSNGRT